MHPELVNIFGFPIAWYGVLITAGVLIGAVMAHRMARARGLNTNLLSDMTLWAVLWGVVGARIFYVLTSPGEFRGASFLQIINIRQGGISIHGGVIFGIIVILYYQWRYKINFYRYVETMGYALALGIIGGRIGNFFNGSDTMGRLTSWPIGFTWPEIGSPILGIFTGARNWQGMPGLCALPNAANPIEVVLGPMCTGGELVRGPVHLTQIYGAIIGLILFIACFFWLRSKRPGWAFWQFVLWYSVLRSVFEESFRLNPLAIKLYLSEGTAHPGIGLLTWTQLLSIPIIIGAIFMLWRIKRMPIPPEERTVAVPAALGTNRE